MSCHERWQTVLDPIVVRYRGKEIDCHFRGDAAFAACRFVIDELKQWREASLYKSEDDFVFPSVLKNGEQAISPDSILKREIRPALKRIGVTKRVGFHTFRHTLATLLGSLGVNVKTTQELLRHANPNITMRIYQQAVSEEKRAAQRLAFSSLYPEGVRSNPPAPNEEE